jgi:hypothetical protein
VIRMLLLVDQDFICHHYTHQGQASRLGPGLSMKARPHHTMRHAGLKSSPAIVLCLLSCWVVHPSPLCKDDGDFSRSVKYTQRLIVAAMLEATCRCT